MFVKNFSHMSRAHVSKSKICFNVKSSTYYFHTKTKILAGFQICIGVPLTIVKLYHLVIIFLYGSEAYSEEATGGIL